MLCLNFLRWSCAVSCCLLGLTAAPVLSQSSAPVTLPLTLSRANTSVYDGVWSGVGTLETGNCAQRASIKFQVREGRIFKDGFTHGAFHGSGTSTLVGVIHADRSVEITITPTNNNGRTSISFGKLNADGEMVLRDPGRCSYTYRLQKT